MIKESKTGSPIIKRFRQISGREKAARSILANDRGQRKL